MTDKNHEQYLEQIEIAVMETTKELMSKHNGDLRVMAKVCAEKQVEINRLKEYQNNDRKTIRDLRGNLKEATEEIDLYKEELDIAHHEYDKIKEEKYSLYLKWSEQKEENEELKTLIENQKDYIDAIPDNVEEYKDELHAVMGENRMLKEEIEFLKNQLDVGGMMNFSKYND